jgi:Zn-dependent M28 family amino/carboxypeptidase
MEGRQTGTAGYDRAARYVVERLKAIGLQPVSGGDFLQPIAFQEQFVDSSASTAALVTGNGETPLRLPADLIVTRGAGPVPESVDAPLVFVGYGLHMPDVGHDDFAGLDLRGKIAVFVSGGPADVSGALKSHARGERPRLLAERGAAGSISLTTPKAVETPWSRRMAQAGHSGMYFADPALRSGGAPFFEALFDPAGSQKLFARSGRSFSDIAALADASKPLPTLDLKQRVRARIVSRRQPVTSANVVARLPGSDPRLRDEHVLLTAHLDHLGVGEPIDGDGLYNGAMDNAAGVAALLDIAQSYRERGQRPKRSMLFVFVTAEEKGLLGSRYYSLRPTVPKRSIVANLNFDMHLPIFPLRGVLAVGAEESTLGATASETGRAMGLPLMPDPFPDRNSFIRSDQYSFIREGVPALAFKFGFAKDSPEAEIERNWRSTRYHAPTDDLSQPVHIADAVRLNDFVADLALRVANAPERPAWLQQSFFRRFAKAE